MHVSCRATRVLVEAVEVLGLDPEELVAGTSLRVEHLLDERERLTWDQFTAVLDNIQRSFPEPEMLERIGIGLSRVPGFRRVNRVGAWLVSPRQVYWFFTRWVGPSMFPAIPVTLGDHPDGRLSITLSIPGELRDSRTWFQICKGGFAAMPRIIGLEDARVEARIEPHRAVYLVTPPEAPTPLARLRRMIGNIGATEYAVAEIERYRQELQESYDALVRSRQDFRALLEKMSDSVCVHRDGVVLWGNRSFVKQLGRERIEDVIGLGILQDIVHPDDRAELANSMRLAAAGQEQARRFRVQRPDGSTIVIEISPTQIVEFDGAPARLVVGRDITEWRRQESAMLMADRMASIGVLAAGVAHEINNPLAYVHANLVVAERELARIGDRGGLSEAIASARDGTDRVRAIVRDLKTLSRGDEEHLEAVELRSVVESALTLARKSIERRARLRLNLPPVPPVRGDRARLGQVVLNMLINAADAIAEGAPGENEIAVATSVESDGHVVLEVRDTGAGIAEGDLARIFDPFFTTKEPGQGTGLGLSICHRIVTGLGGFIEVESAVGKGTTFRVSLAPSPEAPRVVTPPQPVSQTPMERGRVLVIDDEPKLLAVLTTMLSDHHEVVTIDDSRAALERLLGDESFDVIVCDLMMAGMTGMDLYEALRAARPGLEQRMVFMTGGTFTARAHEFIASTPQRCLEKPFEVERLLGAVRERLAASR